MTTSIFSKSATESVMQVNGQDAFTFGTSGITSGAPIGFRNRIINGDMRMDQRNAGASITPTDGQYLVDRWCSSLSVASKYTSQQSSTAPTGFSTSHLVTSSSAYSVTSGDIFAVSQKIEGYNFVDMAWGTPSAQAVTLSFWVRSSLVGTFGGSFTNNANNRSYPFTYTINNANTFEYKTITVAGDTTGTWIGGTNGIAVRVWFGLGVGATYIGTAGAWAASAYFSAAGAVSVVGTSGANFYITGVQIEKGSVATTFEQRPYGMELALCQRYYEAGTLRVQGLCQTSANLTVLRGFASVKRSVPTISYKNTTYSAMSGVVVMSNSIDSFITSAVGTGTLNNSNFITDWTADAEL